MIPIINLDKSKIQNLKYILCDIDDTITTGGKLTDRKSTRLNSSH